MSIFLKLWKLLTFLTKFKKHQKVSFELKFPKIFQIDYRLWNHLSNFDNLLTTLSAQWSILRLFEWFSNIVASSSWGSLTKKRIQITFLSVGYLLRDEPKMSLEFKASSVHWPLNCICEQSERSELLLTYSFSRKKSNGILCIKTDLLW